MIIGQNLYSNANIQSRNVNNVKFKGLSPEAKLIWEKLEQIGPQDGSKFSAFTATQVNGAYRKNRQTAPVIIKEVAEQAKQSKHWAADVIGRMADSLTKLAKK
ncbi:MAG: hypothetical protein A2Y25_10250 [Candidatus Melainabacteria bacterium GWF2_37_15]|nr:MAG: hypothetical protein A2Y25_10250 [Candidatus Melainabacteria bacterium GWF2_37_15]